MLYMSNARVSRRAHRWAWAHRPFDSIDSPVKRYLKRRHGTERENAPTFRRVVGRITVRPAF